MACTADAPEALELGESGLDQGTRAMETMGKSGELDFLIDLSQLVISVQELGHGISFRTRSGARLSEIE